MALYQMIDDGEAEAQAALTSAGAAALPESLEHVRQHVRIDAGTGVGDAHERAPVRHAARDVDPAA